MRIGSVGVLAIALCGCWGCATAQRAALRQRSNPPTDTARIRRVVLEPNSTAAKIVASARSQAAIGADYTFGYFKIGYPGGDLPQNQGVCTDVVIRALRNAGYDLQVLIHRDIVAHFAPYPRREAQPDSNIDHRRVPNQRFFFRRFGKTLSNLVDPKTLAEWHPGDFVYWKLENGLDHTGVLSDAVNSAGVPLVVHNCAQCVEEDALTRWKIVGHYRFPA